MSQEVHTISIQGPNSPARSDRLLAAMVPGVAFAASANAVTALGAITAGTGYLYPPLLAASGGTGSGLTAVATSIKAVSAAVVSGGTSGFAVSDTITLSNGVVLTVGAVTSGVVTAATVSTAGAFTQATTNPVSQVATSGAGVGTTSFTLSYGLGAVQITNSGSYTAVPSITVTPDPRGGGVGSGAAVAAPTLGGNGNAILVSSGAIGMPPAYGVQATSSVPALISCPYKSTAGFTVALTPLTTGSTLAAGTVDLLALG